MKNREGGDEKEGMTATRERGGTGDEDGDEDIIVPTTCSTTSCVWTLLLPKYPLSCVSFRIFKGRTNSCASFYGGAFCAPLAARRPPTADGQNGRGPTQWIFGPTPMTANDK